MPPIRAQNESRLAPPSGWGAFRFDPVAALYLARPLAVKPAPLDTGSFSPRPTDRFTFFLVAMIYLYMYKKQRKTYMFIKRVYEKTFCVHMMCIVMSGYMQIY
jgi:hypothetical protein